MDSSIPTVSIPLVLLCLRPAGGTAVPSGKTAAMACLAAGGFRLKISTLLIFPEDDGKMVRLFFQKKRAINQIQLLLSSMSVDVSSLLVSALMWGGKEDVTATCWMNERFWLPICSTYCLGLEREILALLMSLQEICTLHVGCLFYTYASTQCSLTLASG